jgi:hypothetical protein
MKTLKEAGPHEDDNKKTCCLMNVFCIGPHEALERNCCPHRLILERNCSF